MLSRKLLGNPGRARPAGAHSGPATFRWGFGLSVLLHAGAILGSSLVHPVLAPEGAVPVPYELVTVQAEPEAAPPGPPPPVERQQEPIGPAVQEPLPSPEAAPEPAPVTPTMAEPPAASTGPEPLQPPIEPQPPPTVAPVPEPSPPQDAAREEEPASLAPPAAEAPSAASVVPDNPKPTPRRPSKTQTRSPTRSVDANPQTSGTKGSVASSADATRPTAASISPSVPVPRVEEAQTSPSWFDGVNKWLLAHRSYPETARRLGEQGTAVVRFTVDREGHVLDVILVEGSGSSALDQAAQALLRNARLPPFPSDMVAPVRTITVPIHYRLE